MARLTVDPDKQRILDIWLKITRKPLTREESEKFVMHPALPGIIRSLHRKGPEHVEEVGRARMTSGTLRLVDWLDGLSQWAAGRYWTREEAAQELVRIESRIEARRRVIGSFEIEEEQGVHDSVEIEEEKIEEEKGVHDSVLNLGAGLRSILRKRPTDE